MNEKCREVFSKVRFLGDFGNSVISDNCGAYIMLPSLNNPRWVVPVHNKSITIASLALYQPSLLHAKVIKRLSILLARVGLLSHFVGSKIRFKRQDRVINEIFNGEDLYYAIFTGTEGCHRKITIQVMDKNGVILGYIKVADNKDIEALLNNEAEILGDLMNLGIDSGMFPTVLYNGKAGDVNILITDSVKSTKSTYSSNLSDSHILFLAEVFQKTSKLMAFKESNFNRSLKERFENLEIKKSGKLGIDIYYKVKDYLEKTLGDDRIPFGICHRDFTPWNTFFHNDRLYVFDWEYAEKDYPPLLDIYHFIIQDGILVRKLKPEGLLKSVFKNKALIETFCKLIKIDKDLINPLLLCYLLDISLLYIEREKGILTQNTSKILDIWKEMMEMIIGDR